MTEQDSDAIDSSGEEAVEGLLNMGQRVVDPRLITGMKYLGRLYSLMERLAPAGRERDAAGNRRLLFSQYAGLVLWGLFNPTLQSWRGLSEASRLRKVQQALGGPRASLGSLSESVRVFDPQLLEPIFAELFAQLPQTLRSRHALLMSLTLGDNVGRRGCELICLYLQGWAEEDELLDGLLRLTAKQTSH